MLYDMMKNSENLLQICKICVIITQYSCTSPYKVGHEKNKLRTILKEEKTNEKENHCRRCSFADGRFMRTRKHNIFCKLACSNADSFC